MKAGTRQERFIWLFVFRMGGVTAVARRIVLRRPGLFTWNDIYGEFCCRYPAIEPAQTQINDMLERLERQGSIECVHENENGRLYQRCQRARPYPARLVKPQQAEIKFLLLILLVCLCACETRSPQQQLADHYKAIGLVPNSQPSYMEWLQERGWVYQTNVVETNLVWRAK